MICIEGQDTVSHWIMHYDMIDDQDTVSHWNMHCDMIDDQDTVSHWIMHCEYALTIKTHWTMRNYNVLSVIRNINKKLHCFEVFKNVIHIYKHDEQNYA